MATAGEKTEKPTPHRRRKARERGEVAKSPDLSGALIMFGLMLTISLAAPGMWRAAEEMMRVTLALGRIEPSVEGIAQIYRQFIGWVGLLLLPIVACCLLTALAVNLAQTGLLLSAYPLRWDVQRISPIEGLRRLFSMQGLVQAIKSSAKIGLLMLVAGLTLHSHIGEIVAVGALAVDAALESGLRICLDVAVNCGAVLLIIGALDYVWQRRTHEKQLMMTQHELRRELREMEGDPQIAAQRRRRRRQMLEGGVSREMKDASVVVVNPTHIAVALSYDAAMTAPKVVAKGRGELAMRIVHYARLYGVPLHHDRPLARELYRRAKVGQAIPPALYQAVAEVLAIILRRREMVRRRYGNGDGR